MPVSPEFLQKLAAAAQVSGMPDSTKKALSGASAMQGAMGATPAPEAAAPLVPGVGSAMGATPPPTADQFQPAPQQQPASTQLQAPATPNFLPPQGGAQPDPWAEYLRMQHAGQ